MIGGKRLMPNWGLFIIDLLIVIFSFVLAYNLRFNFQVPDDFYRHFHYVVPYLILVRSVFFFVLKTYTGILRYTSVQDALRIFVAVAGGSIILFIINVFSFKIADFHLVPYAVIIIDFFLSIFFLTGIRVGYKILFQRFARSGEGEVMRVAIFGAGEAGLITKRTMDRDVGQKYKILGFVDDNPALSNKTIEGIPVYHSDNLDNLFSQKEVDQLIISVQSITSKRTNEIVDICLHHKVKVLHVPPPSRWINGELSFRQIKRIKIEDLLQREQIRLDIDKIKKQISNKRVLVTGAAGSIGGEIVRQLFRYQPQSVILLDQAETPLFQMELELENTPGVHNFEIVIGDIRNKDRMENLFRTFKPQIVFHAGAYKHVPMMENNPSEAVLTNVLGTKTLADLSVKYEIEKFVFVSTDKAVNPSNVMGASKRVAEVYVQSLDKKQRENGGHTRFVTTRFGNVLGSNGSVIQLFREQIAKGGPVTVTHPDVTRFFMTIPEACQLVLEAGTIGNGGEIFVFDMGNSVKIVDLAKKMIELSGLELGKDIQLIFTGLRSGEKLFEELLSLEENTLPTHHEKIRIGQTREYSFEEIDSQIQALICLFDEQDNEKIVRQLKRIVPEFKSNNSVFEFLDKEVEKGQNLK